MSKTRRSARVAAVAALVAGLLLAAPAARAASPADVCAAFPHSQTYTGDSGMFRAPAWHYGKTVTVVYETSSCSAEVTSSSNYVLSLSGTAKVYAGTQAAGDPIDKRPFSSVLRSSTTGGKPGWPIDWWACFDGSFSYVWTIQGVYTFAITAENGNWAMTQRDPVSGESTGTSVSTCR